MNAEDVKSGPICDHCGYPIEHGEWKFVGEGNSDDGKPAFELSLSLHRQCMYYLAHYLDGFMRLGSPENAPGR